MKAVINSQRLEFNGKPVHLDFNDLKIPQLVGTTLRQDADSFFYDADEGYVLYGIKKDGNRLIVFYFELIIIIPFQEILAFQSRLRFLIPWSAPDGVNRDKVSRTPVIQHVTVGSIHNIAFVFIQQQIEKL